jgi:hypothetical protein
MFLGAGTGLALGGVLCALSVRRGPPALSGLIAELLAYVVVLAPVFIITDDVGLDEDLNFGGLVFLGLIGLTLGGFALLGGTVGGFSARILNRGRMQRRKE